MPGSGASDAVSMPVDEGLDEPLVELRAGGIPEAAQRLADVERLAIRPGRGHRREGVADREDPGDERDLLAGEAVEVARRRPSARDGGGRRRG